MVDNLGDKHKRALKVKTQLFNEIYSNNMMKITDLLIEIVDLSY
jgi:hypothetical protein